MATSQIDRLVFSDALIECGLVFGVEVTPARIDAYYRLLGEMDTRVFRLALLQLMRTHRYGMPTPADVIRVATDVLAAAGVVPPIKEVAWQQVAKAMRGGVLVTTGAMHDLTRQVVQGMGGMVVFREADDYALSRLEKDFKTLYDGARQEAIVLRRLECLPLPEAGDGAAWRFALPDGADAPAGGHAPAARMGGQRG